MSAEPIQSDRSELVEWRELLDSPGWTRLAQHVHAEWQGPAFAARVEDLANRPDDAAALSQLRQMLAAKRAIERLLKTPAEQVARLERQETQIGPWPSRRGAL